MSNKPTSQPDKAKASEDDFTLQPTRRLMSAKPRYQSCQCLSSYQNLTRCSSRYGVEFVSIKVGKKEKADFVAHKELLAAHSEFFKSAMKSEWKEVCKIG